MTMVTCSKIKRNKRATMQANRGPRAMTQVNRGPNNRMSPKAPTHPLTKKQRGALAFKRSRETTRKETPNTPTGTQRAQQGSLHQPKHA